MAGDSARPLAGKRVLVTRAREQAGEFVSQLEALGAEVLVIPTVKFSDPEDFTELDARIKAIGQFDWLLFTSQNAVTYFVRRCRAIGAAVPTGMKVATSGVRTAEAAERQGFSVQIASLDFRGGELPSDLGLLQGRRVLYPGSDLVGERISGWLRGLGAEVTEVIAYRTLNSGPEDAHPRRLPELDVVTFFSPSAFRNFSQSDGMELLRDMARRGGLAAIGPTTAAAIREAGLTVAIEAPEQTAASFAAAIGDYFDQRAREGVKPR